jgi:hypothetical protein
LLTDPDASAPVDPFLPIPVAPQKATYVVFTMAHETVSKPADGNQVIYDISDA